MNDDKRVSFVIAMDTELLEDAPLVVIYQSFYGEPFLHSANENELLHVVSSIWSQWLDGIFQRRNLMLSKKLNRRLGLKRTGENEQDIF